MTPFQQLYLGMGAKKKTYMDDVFSTYLWAGSGSARAINNGINLSGEGGMVWIKNRTYDSNKHVINDTVRGHSNAIMASETDANTTQAGLLDGFNSNGFDVSTDNFVNGSSQDYASWTFRKSPGFFDVVTWDGNDTAGRVISHSLGSVPGLIMIKSTTHATSWFTYHRDVGAEKYLILNESNDLADQTWFMNDTTPTSTGFSVGSSSNVNGSGRSYVAYVFAGGESTAATARSVEFDGSSDYLSIASTSDFNFGTGDFTIEFWANPDAMGSSNYFLDFRADGSNTGTTNQPLIYFSSSDGTVSYWLNGSARISTFNKAAKGTWAHYAIVRNSGTTTLYMNGLSQGTYSDSTNYPDSPLTIARRQNGGQEFEGKISNLRIVKGTAVYTSSFRPPTEPLTNITNTKLLCCNNSSTTGSTVTPGTITASGSPTASSDSPFDDPAAFTFGKDGDQGIIKCGSFVGNHTTKPEIYLGWEPQYLLWKNADQSQDWFIVDSMRGAVSGANDARLRPNTAVAENTSQNPISLTSTGFKCTNTDFNINGNGDTTVYIAIRRPDGYVGKPAETGTDVLAMDTGAGNSTTPNFDSGFPVDFAFSRDIDSTDNWYTFARLTGKGFMYLQTTGSESDSNDWSWDSNVGWQQANWGSDKQSWMFKRHAGFDVVAAKGRENKRISHSLGKIPEMYWVKNRDSTEAWTVYHKGLNGGTNPENRYILLNTNAAESGSNTNSWNSFAPTSTHISFGLWDATGGNINHDFLVLLFASVDGISKVGYYDGSASSQTITTGFQPRFVIIKCTNNVSTSWTILDTTRGWGSGNDNAIYPNLDIAQQSWEAGAPTSTGFSLTGDSVGINAADKKYIYYAHA